MHPSFARYGRTITQERPTRFLGTRSAGCFRGNRPKRRGARGQGGEPRPEAGAAAAVNRGTEEGGGWPRRRAEMRLEPKQKQPEVERGRGSRLGETVHGCPLEKRKNRVPQSRAAGLLPSCGRGPGRRCPAAATAPFRRRRPLQAPRPGGRPRRPCPPHPRPRPPPGRQPPRPRPAPKPAAGRPPPAPAPGPQLTAGRRPFLLGARQGPLPGRCDGGPALPGHTSLSPQKINHQKIIPEKNGE